MTARTLTIALGFLFFLSVPAFSQRPVNPNEVRVNTAPLSSFARRAGRQIAKGLINPTGSFSLVYDVALRRDGSVDQPKSKLISRARDRKLASIVKEGIDAAARSGYFGYLNELEPGPKVLRITVLQDARTFDSSIRTKLSSVNKASVTASMLGTMLHLARVQSSAKGSTNFFLERVRTGSNGRDIEIRFAAPADKLHELVRKEAQKTI